MSAPPLPAKEAYPLWAQTYGEETVVSAMDDRAVSRLSPPLAGRALLDAGCGTGRRLRAVAGATARAVGVDLVREMLVAGGPGAAASSALVAGDVRALPFRADVFEVVWCRLVLGHLARLEAAYAELGRVARAGARLVVTDFHPAAAAAGHVRSFRDGRGRAHVVVHHVHAEEDHRRAAGAAGWTVDGVHHLSPGPDERAFYERAGRAADYEAHRHLPLVLALCLSR